MEFSRDKFNYQIRLKDHWSPTGCGDNEFVRDMMPIPGYENAFMQAFAKLSGEGKVEWLIVNDCYLVFEMLEPQWKMMAVNFLNADKGRLTALEAHLDDFELYSSGPIPGVSVPFCPAHTDENSDRVFQSGRSLVAAFRVAMDIRLVQKKGEFLINDPCFAVCLAASPHFELSKEQMNTLDMELSSLPMTRAVECIETIVSLTATVEESKRGFLQKLLISAQEPFGDDFFFLRLLSPTADLAYFTEPIKKFFASDSFSEDKLPPVILTNLSSRPDFAKEILKNAGFPAQEFLNRTFSLQYSMNDVKELAEINYVTSIIQYPELIKELDQAEVYSAIKDCTSIFEVQIKPNHPIHKYYDSLEILRRSTSDYMSVEGLLENGLRNICEAGADFIAGRKKGRLAILKFAEQFDLSRPYWRRLIADILANEGPAALIQAMDGLTPSLFEPFEETYHFLEYKKNLGFASDSIYYEYIRLINDSPEKLMQFIAKLKDFDRKFVSQEEDTRGTDEDEYYTDIIKARFPNFSEVSFEQSENAPDRSEDVSKYEMVTRTDRYDINSGLKWTMRSDESPDPNLSTYLAEPVRKSSLMYGAVSFEERLRVFCDVYRRDDMTLSQVSDPKEILALNFLAYRKGALGYRSLLEVVVAYHYAKDANFEAYAQGTTDRVNKATSPDYSMLLNYREFYSDRLVDTLNQLSHDILKDAYLSNLLRTFLNSDNGEQKEKVRKVLAGLPLGMTPSLRQEIGKMRLNDKLPEDRKEEVIELRLQRERQKIVSTFRKFGMTIPLEEIDLETFSSDSAIEKYYSSVHGESVSAGLLAYELKDIPIGIVREIDTELTKYQSEKMQVRHIYPVSMHIAKNRAAAHALRSAAVCLAADVPEQGWITEKCLWNEDYFSVDILMDVRSNQCIGANLLHEYEDKEQLILAVSLHPSSTFLHKVDQSEMFHALVDRLSRFAAANDFDLLLLPKDKMIRTNRTGGEFEKAMNRFTGERNDVYSFETPKRYSYLHNYIVQDFDVLWRRES